MSRLRICGACDRHVKSEETRCPFCDAAQSAAPTPPASPSRATSRASIVLLGAILGGNAAADSRPVPPYGVAPINRPEQKTCALKKSQPNMQRNRIHGDGKIAPEYARSAFVGFRLTHLHEGSILRQIGLENADLIVGIDGAPSPNAGRLSDVYERLEGNKKEFSFTVRRGSREFTVQCTVE